MVRTSRCGRDNPGSNPGHGKLFFCLFFLDKNGVKYYPSLLSFCVTMKGTEHYSYSSLDDDSCITALIYMSLLSLSKVD